MRRLDLICNIAKYYLKSIIMQNRVYTIILTYLLINLKLCPISSAPVYYLKSADESSRAPVETRSLTSSYYVNTIDYDPDDADSGPLAADTGALDESDLDTNEKSRANQQQVNDSSTSITSSSGNINSNSNSVSNSISSSSSTDSPMLSSSDIRRVSFHFGTRKTHTIHWPNAQSAIMQPCNEGGFGLKCDDVNAICELGGCVCKLGFFLHRQSGLCQSISDLLKNCENDHQCQAFNVDMICDLKSRERPFCDCANGLYFDQETHNCLPCLRPTSVTQLPSNTSPTTTTTTTNSLISTSSQTAESSSNNNDQSQPLETVVTNTNATNESLANNNSSQLTSGNSTPERVRFPTNKARLCKPIDLFRIGSRRGHQLNQMGLTPDDRQFYDQFIRKPSVTQAPTTTSTISSSSDPFRIRTPLEVFMGAIMLFTLFTVAWFFLQRMIHDCRAILRSLRNPDFGTGGCTGERLNNFASARYVPPNNHFFDPTGQAVARLFSGDGLSPSAFTGLPPSIYQRDLAGVMVQHLAANLSPSSTSQALAVNGNGSARALGINNEHDAALYPLTASAQQSRTAAAAAAAQLLLSPTHPAIAILRAAAAAQNSGIDYAPTSLLTSMFDPPPKYEEAVAQQAADNQLINQQQAANNIIESQSLDQSGQQTLVASAPPSQLQSENREISDNTNQANQQTRGEQTEEDGSRCATERTMNSMLNVYIPPEDELQGSDDLLRIVTSENVNATTPTQRDQAREETGSQGRPSFNERRASRRSRKSRGSISRLKQQNQDSD